MGNTSKKQPKNVAIGQRVRQYRKSKGFTLQQLAEIVYNLPENKGKERSPKQLG
ncbi:MAG: hypothetical protein IJZ80_00585 [Clostridia bacterium]|nr:hypothetical protein [Clostridia bacterium]